MKTISRKATVLGLGILATLLFASPFLVPTFAWTSSLSTCVASTYTADCTKNPSFAVGTTVSDTAQLILSNDGSPYGTVYFAVAAGTCADHGSLLSPGPTPASFSATGASSPPYPATTPTTYTSSLSTTGLSAGSYVWLVYYSGTGTNGYPRAPTSGYDCEPFTLTALPPPISTPQFPFGIALLMAIVLPALVLLKKKSNVSSVQTP